MDSTRTLKPDELEKTMSVVLHPDEGLNTIPMLGNSLSTWCKTKDI